MKNKFYPLQDYCELVQWGWTLSPIFDIFFSIKEVLKTKVCLSNDMETMQMYGSCLRFAGHVFLKDVDELLTSEYREQCNGVD